ncbi:hypothetical protein ACFUJR_11850 [Streptomyces sp. NPDC057271]|uniref:hypothetical protein n=1 Tax=unclassified Streptomyces TaxID=2593676 RepID=UPI003629F35A
MRRQRSLLTVVALCLGGALTACGGGEGEGYAAVGAGSGPKDAVRPSGSVTLFPLDSPSASGTTSSTSSPSPRPPGTTPGPTPVPSTGGTGAGGTGTGGDTGTDAGTGTGTGTTPGTPRPGTAPARPGTTPPRTTTAPAPGTTTTPPPATPATPAALTLSAPVLADADKRWCERVTVTFRNTGGTAATSGTVTFATHIIGALGVDWATIESAQPLPAPIAAGAARTQTYTVCVDSWRVPLGMHVDTQRVTATWK